jgi:hypothetical protein
MRDFFRLLPAYRYFVLAFVVGMADWIGRNLSPCAFAGHTNNHRTGWITGAAVVVAISITMPSHATTGTVRVTVAKAGFILGAGGGKGVLTFQHRNYPFAVQGLSLGLTAGASINNLVGRAEHIKELGDFAGTYTVMGAGAAVVGGVGGVHLRNAKGVKIILQGPKGGIEASANVTRVVITLDQSRSTPD